MLGPLEAWIEGEPRPLGGPKQRVILALLALRLGQVVPADDLIEAGWGDALPANPANTLQHQVAQLRKLIEPEPGTPRHLLTVGAGYRLDRTTVSTDAAGFEADLAGARALRDADPGRAATILESALGRWRGQALSDVRYHDFATGPAERLEGLRLSAIELQIDLAMAAGQHEHLVPRLAELTAEHPLVESLWTRRVDALERSGRSPEALRAIEEARHVLVEIGLDIGPELRDRQRSILGRGRTDDAEDERPAAVEPAHGAGTGAPVASGPRAPSHNLPAPPNRLIGRSDEAGRIGELLDAGGLVTLLGPGGAGKTRLALAVARDRLDRHPGGVWFAALDALDDPSLLAAEIGRVTAMEEKPDRAVIDTLVDHLDGQGVLLVLDNCEHVVGPVADLVEALLGRCGLLSILATSQVVLATPGERIHELAPLATPGRTSSIYDPIPEIDAVALFVERAEQAGAAVERWDESAMAAVANIASALDGLPLAIELAAARTRSMALEEIARGLDDRFSLLTGGARTAPDRQRSLADAVAWSLGLLDDDLRTMMAELSVLVGRFDAEDAAAVTGRSPTSVRDALASLVDRSLVTRTGDIDGAANFTLLETMRQHGRLALPPGDLARLRAAHLEHFATLAARADAGIRGPDQLRWLRRLDGAYDNVRAALAWSLDGGSIETGVALGAALGRYWDWRGQLAEGSLWATRLDANAEGTVPGLASVLAWRAYLAWESGDLDEAVIANERAIAAAEAIGEPAELAAALSASVLVARTSGDLDGATERGEQLLAASEAAADPWLVAWTDSAMATVAVAAGRLDDAAALARSATERFAEVGDRRGESWGRIAMAEVGLDRGDVAAAAVDGRAALAAARAVEDDRSILWSLEILAEVANRNGRPEVAARRLGAARPLRESRGLAGSVLELGKDRRLEAELRRTIAGRLDALIDQGRGDRAAVVAEALDDASPADQTGDGSP